MASRNEDSDNFRTDPRAAPASGRRVPPTSRPADPPFGVPPGAEPGRAEQIPRSSPVTPDATVPRPAPARRPRTDVIPRGRPVEEGDPVMPARGRRRLGPVARRVRTTVKHVDPVSVFKISLCFYSVLLVLWLVLVAVVYSVVASLGLFTSIHNLGEAMEFEPLATLDITLGVVEKWAALIGIAGVLLGSLLNLFLAFFYNVASDLFGGIEVTSVERDYKG